MDQDFIVRPAVLQDIPSINAILTHYALHTVMTFATEGPTDQDLAAKLRHITEDNRFPFLVATPRSPSHENTSPDVLGISYITSWRPDRLAYQHTGEISLFVHHEHQGKGVGSALLRALLEATAGTKLKELLAVMAVDAEGKAAGLALRDYYIRWGFRDVGTMEKVGFKFKRW
jgi:L-amino acid N-acyltransferase YncA